uniref:MyTH4 domain-containing protein n=1 Tax=Scleropages formosus TaxID=113540 RepID=A0A8C9W338_SCLFO
QCFMSECSHALSESHTEIPDHLTMSSIFTYLGFWLMTTFPNHFCLALLWFSLQSQLICSFSTLAPQIMPLCRESCILGWRLLSLVMGFFPCSNTLKPYVMQHLQYCTQDSTNPYQELSRICQENLMRSLIYGGRRYVPSHVEIRAILGGDRSGPCFACWCVSLCGFMCCVFVQVALDVMTDLCAEMGVLNPREIKEFSVQANQDQGERAHGKQKSY